MATTRSFQKPFEMVDFTQEINLVPNQWGLINQMGLFRDESVAQHTITVEQNEGTLGLITDQVRGARNNANQDDTRSLRSFAIPHYPLDDYLSPQDVQGKRAYGSADEAETQAAVLERKMQRIARNHFVTREYARTFALTTGGIYAPNGTVVGNYYTDFGVTRKSVAFDLSNAATDVVGKGEEVIAHIQDNILSGEVVDSITMICSPEFFSALIKQAGIKEAYKFYSSSQEVLRERQGSGLYRRFSHGGIDYVEYRGEYNGQRLIPANEAYAVPMGTLDMFISYNSPANKFSHVNTLGELMYMFSYSDPHDEKVLIQTEQNALHLIRRPQAVVRCVAGATI